MPINKHTIAINGDGDFKIGQEAVTACPKYSEKRISTIIINGVFNEMSVIHS
jgi:hypothetical protein